MPIPNEIALAYQGQVRAGHPQDLLRFSFASLMGTLNELDAQGMLGVYIGMELGQFFESVQKPMASLLGQHTSPTPGFFADAAKPLAAVAVLAWKKGRMLQSANMPDLFAQWMKAQQSGLLRCAISGLANTWGNTLSNGKLQLPSVELFGQFQAPEKRALLLMECGGIFKGMDRVDRNILAERSASFPARPAPRPTSRFPWETGFRGDSRSNTRAGWGWSGFL